MACKDLSAGVSSAGEFVAQAAIDKVIRSKRRTIALQVSPDASLIVRAPERASFEAIHAFVMEKLAWIQRKQAAARATLPLRALKRFVSGEEFYYLGQRYKLHVVNESAAPLVFTEDGFVLSAEYRAQARARFIAWYKRQAREVLHPRAEFFADQAGLRYSRINITSAKKQWGSCNTRGVLNFSWRVIMAPIMVVDYVAAHEIAHLAEHNHSKRFWEKVRIIFPQYLQAKAWLRQNHHFLDVF